ncbi:hypothetical protein [Halorubellus litoreus]|uniref:HEAT repeat-containing protein n=1 Tax=Halorubellus litoreus TaxID=755308 RepID=A0ABD5VC65_9EURY
MSPSDDAVRAGRDRLTAADPDVRGDAAAVLRDAATDPDRGASTAVDVLWTLARVVDDPDPRTRAYARAALQERTATRVDDAIDEPVDRFADRALDDVIAALDAPDAERRAAAAALLRFSLDDTGVRDRLVTERARTLTAALDDPHAPVRRHVVEVWRQATLDDHEHAAVLRALAERAFADPDPRVRGALVHVPFTYDADAARTDRGRAAFRAFLDLFDDPDPAVRQSAVGVFPESLLRTVASYWDAPDLVRQAADRLVARLDDDVAVVRKRAAHALAKAGGLDHHPLLDHPDPGRVVDALLAACDDRTDGAVGLGGTPATRGSASRVLVDLADDHPDWLRPHADAVIGALDSEHADARACVAYAAARVAETDAQRDRIREVVATLAADAPEAARDALPLGRDLPAPLDDAFDA